MLEEHIGYLGDGRRTELYRVAINAAVRPGDVVVDLGCGTGLLGLLALHAGASRVYAIDSGPIANVARETFSRAGFASRATVLLGSTFGISLPEQADVLVCDHVGFFGFDYGILRLLDDSRSRFLKPGGKIVPSVLDIAIAPVEAPEIWKKANSWRGPAVPAEFGWVGEASLNSKHSADLDGQSLLSPPATPLRLDLSLPSQETLTLKASFTAAQAGTLHGIAGFFDCELHGDVRMTNAPGAAGSISRHQAFMPLSEPLPVIAAEVMNVIVTARPAEDILAWEVRLPRLGIRLRQSTLQSMMLNPDDLQRRQPDYRPRLSTEAAARVLVAGLCDGTRSVAEITAEVLKRYPHLRPDPAEARRFVDRIIESDTI